MTALAPHLSAFLRDHLCRERNVSHHTVAAYATCFALLVRFAADRLKHRQRLDDRGNRPRPDLGIPPTYGVGTRQQCSYTQWPVGRHSSILPLCRIPCASLPRSGT